METKVGETLVFLVSVAQAFQPVPRKQVISAQPGKAVLPKEAGTEARPTELFLIYGWGKGP